MQYRVSHLSRYAVRELWGTMGHDDTTGPVHRPADRIRTRDDLPAAPLDPGALAAFLADQGVTELSSYLALHGADPVTAFENRLQWALWSFRNASYAQEARFLIANQAALRERAAELMLGEPRPTMPPAAARPAPGEPDPTREVLAPPRPWLVVLLLAACVLVVAELAWLLVP